MNTSVYDLNFMAIFLGAVIIINVVTEYQNYIAENNGFRRFLDILKIGLPFLFVAFVLMTISKDNIWYQNMSLALAFFSILSDVVVISSSTCSVSQSKGWCVVAQGTLLTLAQASVAVIPLLLFKSNPAN